MRAVATLEIVVRQSLALILFAAGMAKLFDAKSTADVIKAYELLPNWLTAAAGWLLPKLEVILALSLILNIWPYASLATSCVLFGLFATSQASVIARGKVIPCGCFGTSEDIVTMRTLLRTLSFLAIAVCGLCLQWPVAPTKLGPVQSLTEVCVTQIEVTCLFGLGLCLLQARRNDAILEQGHLSITVQGTPRLRRASS